MKKLLPAQSTSRFLYEAYSYILKHPILYLYGLITAVICFIPSIFINIGFDPYGIFTLLQGIFGYISISFLFIIPLLLHRGETKKFTVLTITKLIYRSTGKLLRFWSFLIFIIIIIIASVYAIDPIFQTKFAEQILIDTTKVQGFGFYPAKAVFDALAQIILSFYYFIPVIYFIESLGLLKSVKRSIFVSVENISFLLPIIIFYTIYYFVLDLYVPDGNLYVRSVSTVFDTATSILVMAACYFFYKETYKIAPYTEPAKEEKLAALTIEKKAFNVVYTLQDYYEGFRLYNLRFNSKWGLRIVGLILSVINIIFLISDRNLINVLPLILSLPLIFVPERYFVKLSAWIIYYATSWIEKNAEISIGDKGISTKSKLIHTFVKWKSVHKNYHSNDLLVLERRFPFLPVIANLTFIPRRYFEAKEWETFIAFIEQKLQPQKLLHGNKEKPKRLTRWSIIAFFIVAAEIALLIGFAFVVELHSLDSGRESVYLPYLFLAVILPFFSYLINFDKYSVGKNLLFPVSCLIAIIIFFGALIAIIPAPQDSAEVKQQYSADELWNAINGKREAYGVPKLVKNSWACEAALSDVEKNAALGNGSVTADDEFSKTIEETQDKYRNDPTMFPDDLPTFLFEYYTYGLPLETTIEEWEKGSGKLLFLDKQYTIGCAAVKDGYGIVITGEQFITSPQEPDI